MAGSQGPPERWLVVLRAVADACEIERADSVPTPLIRRHLRTRPEGATPSSARALLRTLRRHGYVISRSPAGDGPVRWAPTAKGRARLKHHS